MADGAHSGSSALFGIFLLSISSLVLIPYTIYHLVNKKEDDVVQPWTGNKHKSKSKGSSVATLLTKHNIILGVCWVVWLLLIVAVQNSSFESKPFDPFEILQVAPGADDKAIKKAYR